MSETLLGVIIGAFSAIAGGIIGELIKSHLENKRFRREKMREAYEAASRCLIESVCFEEYREPQKYLQTVDDMAVKMSLYASKNVLNFYDNMSPLIGKTHLTEDERHRLGSLSDTLDNMMRVDLGIDKRPFLKRKKC